MYVKDVPELVQNLMPTSLMWIIYGLTIQTGILAFVGFFAVTCNNKFMTQNFIYIKIFQFIMLALVLIFMSVNLVRFSALQGFGVSGYLEDNWPRIMKAVDASEFESGLMACSGGKYLKNTTISASFSEVECPVWPGYEDMTKRDFVALLWEYKGQGIITTDEAMYGCLNVDCASSLKSGLVANQFIMMFALLGLAFLNFFQIGLALQSMKFDIHYRSIFLNVVIFLTLVGIITGGFMLTFLYDFPVLNVNQNSTWDQVALDQLPVLTHTTEFSESEWYPINTKFAVVESCEGIIDPKENCNPLDYKFKIQATSGTLRVSLRPEETLTDALNQREQDVTNILNFEGKIDVINQMLAGTEFSPACDEVNPGLITLIVTASAFGPQAKT